MMSSIFTVVVLCSLLQVLAARPTKQDDIRIFTETLVSKYDHKIAILTERIEENERQSNWKIAALEERVLHLEMENRKLADENSNNKREKESLSKMTRIVSKVSKGRDDGTIRQVDKDMSSTNTLSKIAYKHVEVRKYHPRFNSRAGRAVDYGMNIAFTAYLDHDMDNIGKSQTVIFNKVLLNDGNGYNNYTGAFIAPVNGVYSFSFFIGQRNQFEAQARLLVNNQNKVGVAVEGAHNAQDLQGGNTANLRLTKGDSVYVNHQGGGTHIEGGDGLRTTTFSGFLIYPVETVNVVGK